MPRKDAPDAWLLSFAGTGDEACERALLESAVPVGGLKGAFPWRTAQLGEIAALRRDPGFLALCHRAELGLWKPTVIAEQLQAIPKGDLLLYHDAGRGFWGDFAFRSSIAPLVEWVVSFNRGLVPGVWMPEDGRNARWTPAATFRAMNCDTAPFHESPQAGTTFSLWRHDEFSLDLLDKWVRACLAVYGNGGVGDGREKGDDHGDFVADRGAQSILTNLLVREEIACYGKPYQSSAVQFHPIFAPVPASDIGGLVARIARDRAADVPAPGRVAGTAAAGRRALFTSIPPTLDRRTDKGFQIGSEYQRDCVQSWLDCGFEIYSVHFAEEIDHIKRLPGVNYVGMKHTPDDRPGDRKPSLRAILKLMQEVGADLSGIINSDILLLNPPGWIDTVQAELPGSIIAVSRFEIDEERTCVGAAPWGIDLYFIDRRFIEGLKYCGMRIGETWWDYWLPLWCWFQGARIKHVSDYVALHLDHPVISSERVQEYGLRFLRQIEREASGAPANDSRLAWFHRYLTQRIASEKPRTAITDEDSRKFVERILNPTVWAAMQDLLHRNELTVVAMESPHHRVLARTLVATARVAETEKSRPRPPNVRLVERVPASYLRLAGMSRESIANGSSLVEHVNGLKRRWPYRVEQWFSNFGRRAMGKPPRVRPPAATVAEAVDQILRLKRHLLWRFLARVDAALHKPKAADANRSRAKS